MYSLLRASWEGVLHQENTMIMDWKEFREQKATWYGQRMKYKGIVARTEMSNISLVIKELKCQAKDFVLDSEFYLFILFELIILILSFR